MVKKVKFVKFHHHIIWNADKKCIQVQACLVLVCDIDLNLTNFEEKTHSFAWYNQWPHALYSRYPYYLFYYCTD